jgi:hypothetical protein
MQVVGPSYIIALNITVWSFSGGSTARGLSTNGRCKSEHGE